MPLCCHIGVHGDGHPDNTRTPIVAWGAGIQGPDKVNPQGHDEFSADWDLDAYSRYDVKQADIAPLMVDMRSRCQPLHAVREPKRGKLTFFFTFSLAARPH